MSDAADRLAQALRDVVNEAVRDVINEAVRVAAVRQERPTPAPPRAAERPEIPQDDFLLCPWCNKKHMRNLMPVKEARHQLGGIGPTTFYALVKEGELSLVKLGRRSFVEAEEL